MTFMFRMWWCSEYEKALKLNRDTCAGEQRWNVKKLKGNQRKTAVLCDSPGKITPEMSQEKLNFSKIILAAANTVTIPKNVMLMYLCIYAFIFLMQTSDTLSICISSKTEFACQQSLVETKSYTLSHRILHVEITTIFYKQGLHYLLIFCHCLFYLIILFKGNKRSDEASPGSPH